MRKAEPVQSKASIPGLVVLAQGQVWTGDIYAAREKSCRHYSAGDAGSPSAKGELPASYFNIVDGRQQDRGKKLPKPREQGQQGGQAHAVSAAEQRIQAAVDGRDIEGAGD